MSSQRDLSGHSLYDSRFTNANNKSSNAIGTNPNGSEPTGSEIPGYVASQTEAGDTNPRPPYWSNDPWFRSPKEDQTTKTKVINKGIVRRVEPELISNIKSRKKKKTVPQTRNL